MSKDKYVGILSKGTVVKSEEHSYTIMEVLGQGGFGITYKAVDEKNQVLALKEHFIRSRCFREGNGTDMGFLDTAAREIKDSLKEFKREGRLLMEISNKCPNIVWVYEVFDANNTAYYSMEYLAGGSLRDLVRKERGSLGEDRAKAIIEPIAKALAYLHTEKILHMDIKPDNIVMRVEPDNGKHTPVLIDFGVSLHFDDQDKLTTTHHIAGVTRGFSPIEQYDPIERFAPTVDIYALAATLFYLLTGRNPIAAPEIKQEWIRENLPKSISHATISAIVEGMEFRHEERPQCVEDFLELLDGGTIIVDPKKPHKLQYFIAASFIMIIVGAVIWGLTKGGEKSSVDMPNDDTAVPVEQSSESLHAKYYKMSGDLIGDNRRVAGVDLYIEISGDKVSGICKYVNQKNVMSIEGSIDQNNKMFLTEKIDTLEGGHFDGHFTESSYEGEWYKGKWSKKTNQYSFDLMVSKVEEDVFFDEVKSFKFAKPQKPVPTKQSEVVIGEEEKKPEEQESNLIQGETHGADLINIKKEGSGGEETGSPSALPAETDNKDDLIP